MKHEKVVPLVRTWYDGLKMDQMLPILAMTNIRGLEFALGVKPGTLAVMVDDSVGTAAYSELKHFQVGRNSRMKEWARLSAATGKTHGIVISRKVLFSRYLTNYADKLAEAHSLRDRQDESLGVCPMVAAQVAMLNGLILHEVTHSIESSEVLLDKDETTSLIEKNFPPKRRKLALKLFPNLFNFVEDVYIDNVTMTRSGNIGTFVEILQDMFFTKEMLNDVLESMDVFPKDKRIMRFMMLVGFCKNIALVGDWSFVPDEGIRDLLVIMDTVKKYHNPQSRIRFTVDMITELFKLEPDEPPAPPQPDPDPEPEDDDSDDDKEDDDPGAEGSDDDEGGEDDEQPQSDADREDSDSPFDGEDEDSEGEGEEEGDEDAGGNDDEVEDEQEQDDTDPVTSDDPSSDDFTDDEDADDIADDGEPEPSGDEDGEPEPAPEPEHTEANDIDDIVNASVKQDKEDSDVDWLGVLPEESDQYDNIEDMSVLAIQSDLELDQFGGAMVFVDVPEYSNDAPLRGLMTAFEKERRQYEEFARSLKQVRSQKEFYEPNRKRGRLLPQRLSRAATDGAVKGIRRQLTLQSKDYEFMILIDLSASMRSAGSGRYHRLISLVLSAGTMLYEALDKINGIDLKLLGHSADGSMIGYEGAYGSLGRGAISKYAETHPGKGSTTVYLIADSVIHHVSSMRRRMSLIVENVNGSRMMYDNRDGEAILRASKEFNTDKMKVMLVLSDGRPNAIDYPNPDYNTRKAINMVRDSDIQVFSLSLTTGVQAHNDMLYGAKNNFVVSGGDVGLAMLVTTILERSESMS